ncbi:MAG: hypothetical protein E7530_05865 [Ruminococcaceae bacterium]|nr:hypothetical protein [Oscillospiraceae bacterium]
MAKKKKLSEIKIILVSLFIVFAIVASIFVISQKSKSQSLTPEEVALTFTETITNRGDGYTAYKYTLISKNYKYEDYVRENFMYPIIYGESHYQSGMDTHNLKGLNDKSYMGEKTKNDDGTLTQKLSDRMFPYYMQLMTELNGWDKYNTFYIKYFAKLLKVREDIYGDKYMTEEIMFTVLESNVKTYDDKLAGTEDDTFGLYEKKYGENCTFTYTITETKDIELEEYNKHVDEATFKTYKISADDITEVKGININIQVQGETVVNAQKVLVVKAHNKWYVDNTNTNTAKLYNFYK